MKIILLIPFILLLKFQQIDNKLNGKYKVIPNRYEEEYEIFFNDSIYKKVFKNGKVINGVIEYKNLIYLTDYESSLKIVNQKLQIVQTEKLKTGETISLRDTEKDTIRFCLHKLTKDGPGEWLDFCQNSGKMIKIK